MKNLIIAAVGIVVMGLGASCGGGGGAIFNPDNTAPEIAINGVTEGETYGALEDGPDTLNISAVASDEAGIANMSMRINGTLVAAANESQLEFAWDVTGYDDGQYTVLVEATDDNGNTSTSEVTAGVNNELIFIPPLDFFPDFPIIELPGL
jgi:hypothetical protein